MYKPLTRGNAVAVDGGIWGAQPPSTSPSIAKYLVSGSGPDGVVGEGGERAANNAAAGRS